MGRQVNYFLTPPDLAIVEAAARAAGPLAILTDRTPTATPRRVASFDSVANGGFRHYFVREQDLGAVITRFVPQQQYWLVDPDRSPVIEADACFFDGEVLRIGRLYYREPSAGADDGFRRWAVSVLRRVKRRLRRVDWVYVGPDTERWAAARGIAIDPSVHELPNPAAGQRSTRR